MKTLRGGAGRRSHDEAQPWGGLGYDVKSNTYPSVKDKDKADTASVSSSESGTRTSGSGRSAAGRRSTDNPGKSRGETLLERLLGSRASTGAGAALPPKF